MYRIHSHSDPGHAAIAGESTVASMLRLVVWAWFERPEIASVHELQFHGAHIYGHENEYININPTLSMECQWKYIWNHVQVCFTDITDTIYL
jgi:hypothetical protein